MKKTLFFLMASSSLAFGQELLFQQTPLASDYFANIDVLSSALEQNNNRKKAIHIADDFELAKDSKITKIKFTGHIEDSFIDFSNLLGWQMFIYTDNNGKPMGIPSYASGNAFRTHCFAFGRNTDAITMTADATNPKILTVEWDLNKSEDAINTAFLYRANTKYWLTISSVIIDNTAQSVTESDKKHFYWAASTSNLPKLEKAKLVDPADAYGYGYTNWTDVSRVSPMVSGMAFELYGNPVLATNEVKKEAEVSVYPNPTADNLNVKTDRKFKSLTIFNAEGKLVRKSEQSLVDVKTLAVGQYIIHIELEDGTKTSVKFIKK